MYRILKSDLLLLVLLILMAPAPLSAEQQSPLRGPELSRFVQDLPYFLRWARGQGMAFDVYPQPRTLFDPAHEKATRQALERADWDPERFVFLLCTAGAAATACAPACGRPLSQKERALLEGHMPRLLDAFGTGP